MGIAIELLLFALFAFGIYAKEKQFIIPYKGKEAISFTLFLGNKRVPIEQKVNILQQYCYITENDVKKIDEPLKSNFRLPLKVGNDIHNGFELPIVIYFTNDTEDNFNIPFVFYTFKEEDFDEIINYNEYSFGFGYEYYNQSYSFVHQLKSLDLVDYLAFTIEPDESNSSGALIIGKYQNIQKHKATCKVIKNAIMWSCVLNSVIIGNFETNKPTVAYFNTNTPYINVPEDFF